MAEDFKLIDEHGDTICHKKDYLEYLKGWCVVMGTQWNVDSVSEMEGVVTSTEHDSDVFLNYIYSSSPQVYNFRYTIVNNQITILQYYSREDHEEKEIASRKKMKIFQQWVANNHPNDLKYFGRSDKEAAEGTKKLLLEFLKG